MVWKDDGDGGTGWDRDCGRTDCTACHPCEPGQTQKREDGSVWECRPGKPTPQALARCVQCCGEASYWAVKTDGGGGGGGGGNGGGGGTWTGDANQAYALTDWDRYLMESWKQYMEWAKQYFQDLAGLRTRLGEELEALPRRYEEWRNLLRQGAREAWGADVYATGIPVAGAHELALQRAFQEADAQAQEMARQATLQIGAMLQNLYQAPLQFANPMGLLQMTQIPFLPREMAIQGYLQKWREHMAQQDLWLRLLQLLMGFNPYMVLMGGGT